MKFVILLLFSFCCYHCSQNKEMLIFITRHNPAITQHNPASDKFIITSPHTYKNRAYELEEIKSIVPKNSSLIFSGKFTIKESQNIERLFSGYKIEFVGNGIPKGHDIQFEFKTLDDLFKDDTNL